MRVIVMSLAALGLLACGDPPATTGTSTAAPAGSAAASLAAGTRVLVSNGRVGFVEGEVIGVVDGQVSYRLGATSPDGGATARASAERALVWPVGDGARPASGEHLACELRPRAWAACEVLSASGSRFTVQDRFGDRHDLSSPQLVTVDAQTSARLGTYLARETRHRAFDEAFKAAGEPARPAGWKPRKGELIVVHFASTSWYGAAALSFDPAKERVRVSYHGDTFDDRDVPLERVIPEPSGPAELARDQFVIVRPQKPSELWPHARVVGTSGDSVEVIDRDDVKRKVARRDVAPLEPAAVKPAPASQPAPR